MYCDQFMFAEQGGESSFTPVLQIMLLSFFNCYIIIEMEEKTQKDFVTAVRTQMQKDRGCTMKTKDELPECPVATTVSIIGSKWKLLIMRNLLVRPWRFNELKKDLDGISQKVLTDSLRSMEEDGIITRTVYPEVPPRVEYALSELGESMRPILDAMQKWGTDYKNTNSV